MRQEHQDRRYAESKSQRKSQVDVTTTGGVDLGAVQDDSLGWSARQYVD